MRELAGMPQIAARRDKGITFGRFGEGKPVQEMPELWA
jgi:hypothetical protein